MKKTTTILALALILCLSGLAHAQDFMWPLGSSISQGYNGNVSGSCDGWYYNQSGSHLYRTVSTQGKLHRAVDLPGNYGQALFADRGATVKTGWDGSFGNYILLTHGDSYYSFYAHLSSFAVATGATVKTGQLIGYVGATGSGTAPNAYHLHFEIRSNGATNCPYEARYIPSQWEGFPSSTSTANPIPYDYPGIGAPAPATGLTAWTTSSTSAHFQWSPSATPGTTYWLDISTTSSFSAGTWWNVDMQLGTSHDALGLISGQMYYWRVWATNGPASNGQHGNGPAIATGATIVNDNSGMCAEVADYSTSAGGNVSQWGCYGGNNQKWRMNPVGGGYYNIINVNSGLCMDVYGASTADGANIDQWYCNGGTNQRFYLQPVGGRYELVAQHSGKCVEVYGFSTADGGDITQWGCWGGQNQLWTVNW